MAFSRVYKGKLTLRYLHGFTQIHHQPRMIIICFCHPACSIRPVACISRVIYMCASHLDKRSFISQRTIRLSFYFNLRSTGRTYAGCTERSFQRLIFALFLADSQVTNSLFIRNKCLYSAILIKFHPIGIYLAGSSSVTVLQIYENIIVCFFIIKYIPMSRPPNIIGNG